MEHTLTNNNVNTIWRKLTPHLITKKNKMCNNYVTGNIKDVLNAQDATLREKHQDCDTYGAHDQLRPYDGKKAHASRHQCYSRVSTNMRDCVENPFRNWEFNAIADKHTLMQ